MHRLMPVSDPVVIAVYGEIIDTIDWEKKEGCTMSPKEMIKTPVARKRLLIGMSPRPFWCMLGTSLRHIIWAPSSILQVSRTQMIS